MQTEGSHSLFIISKCRQWGENIKQGDKVEKWKSVGETSTYHQRNCNNFTNITKTTSTTLLTSPTPLAPTLLPTPPKSEHQHLIQYHKNYNTNTTSINNPTKSQHHQYQIPMPITKLQPPFKQHHLLIEPHNRQNNTTNTTRTTTSTTFLTPTVQLISQILPEGKWHPVHTVSLISLLISQHDYNSHYH